MAMLCSRVIGIHFFLHLLGALFDVLRCYGTKEFPVRSWPSVGCSGLLRDVARSHITGESYRCILDFVRDGGLGGLKVIEIY